MIPVGTVRWRANVGDEPEEETCSQGGRVHGIDLGCRIEVHNGE